jgi:hypothetical protein
VTALDVDAVEARANAATLPPWGVRVDEPGQTDPVVERHFEFFGMQVEHVATTETPEDAIFIATARDDIPALVGEVRRLRLALADEQQRDGSARAARVRELEAAARVDYAALRADVDNVSVAELAAAEARVVALAEAADVYEGRAF